MKMIAKVFCLFAVALSFTSCEKERKHSNSIYIHTSDTLVEPLVLFVDNKPIGDLPLVLLTLDQSLDDQRIQMLHFSLPDGKYRVNARNASGTIHWSSDLDLNGWHHGRVKFDYIVGRLYSNKAAEDYLMLEIGD